MTLATPRRLPHALVAVLALAGLASAHAGHSGSHALERRPGPPGTLAPSGDLPAGVADLDLAALFVFPIGPRGLEHSAQARALDGRRVRVVGYMVERDLPAAGRFLLAPRPVALHESEYGQADDLPPQMLDVHWSARAGEIIEHDRRPLQLTGKLLLGPSEEPGGRRWHARLVLEGAPATASIVPNPSITPITEPSR